MARASISIVSNAIVSFKYIVTLSATAVGKYKTVTNTEAELFFSPSLMVYTKECKQQSKITI